MIEPETPPARGPLRTAEAAGLLGTTPAHVAALIRTGALEAADVSIGGARRRAWRIPHASLDRSSPSGDPAKSPEDLALARLQ